jgi:TatA/E family protein of Tat protein translocase
MLEGPDLIVILVIALIIFGPKKLPEIGKAIGHAIREFKKSSQEVKESFEEEIKKVEETRSHATSVGLVSDLSKKTSDPLALPENLGEGSLPKMESVASVPLGNEEKGKIEKLEGLKDGWEEGPSHNPS